MKYQTRSLFPYLLLGGLILALMISTSGAFAGPLPQAEEETPTPIAPTPPPPTLTVEQAAPEAGLTALELARQQGPEAVVALAQVLRGAALDAAMPEIVEAQRQIALAAPPRPATISVSLAEEEAILQAQAALDAASRARALAGHDDPAEYNAPPLPPLPPQTYEISSQVDRTVGSGCTYATIAAAMMAANNGDRLLLEGGVVFTASLSIQKSLTLQGGYAGCASGSSDLTTINANNVGRGMYIYDNLTVTLENLNVTNGNTAAYGAGIFVYTNTHLIGTNLNIYNNTTTALGGGVFLWGARATFTNTEIFNNTAPDGAGVYGVLRGSYAPALNLASNSDIYDNNALTGAGSGGGVYMNQGTVIVTNSSDIHANNAIEGGGAYLISSTLTIEGEYSEIMFNTATGNGGGVYALGSTVNVRDSAALYANAAGTGGAGNGGGAYLDNSDLWGDKALIYHNTATDFGGGVYAINDSLLDMDLGGYPCAGPRCSQLSYNTATGTYGGGAYVRGSEVDLRQIFVENNTGSLGGAIYAWRDPTAAIRAVYIYNCLFAGNNGGSADAIRLYAGTGETTRMIGSHNTLAYNPSAGDGIAIATGGSGTLNLDLSNSIVWGHTTSLPTGHTVTYSDIQGGYTGTGNMNVDPLFIAPASANFHLQSLSPVIDRCTTGQALDFDNELRPITYVRPATPYDMGADEASARVGINGATCTYGRIQDAVDAAASGDTIQATADIFFETVNINGKNLTLVGGYDVDCTTYITGTTIVDGSASSDSVFDIAASMVTLRNLQITGGNAIGGGVDADAGAHVTLDNLRVTGNTGTYGAGLYVGTTAVMTLTNGTRIENNTATIDGGGARVWGKLVITSWLGGITDNTAPNGGGVSVPGGVLELRPGHVGNNQATAADGRGGGIHVLDGGVITATGSSNVYRNSAYDGGGIYADDARVTLWAVIHSNTAANNGGGIYLTNGSVLYAASTSIGDDYPGRHNEATAGAGGGIYAQDSTVEFNGRIYNNRAATQGGGIFAISSTITLTDAYVGGTGANQANQLGPDGHIGVGLYLNSGTHATLDNTVVAGNTFQTTGFAYGGGLALMSSSIVTMTGSSVENHLAPSVADGRGAGIYINNSTVTLDNSRVISNTAGTAGGGLRLWNESTLNVLNNSVIANNHALNGPGGAIAAEGTPTIHISNATLRDNTATTNGGAIYIDAGALNVDYTYLHGNSAARGGAVYQTGTTPAAQVSNSLIYHNTVTDSGAGIHTDGGAFILYHVTLANNVGGPGFSGVASAVYNTIAWGNGGYPGFATAPTTFSCNIDDGGNAGLDQDPLFVAPGAGEDYRLRSGSPAIDACSTGLSPDLDNVPRPLGSGYDMGAYEYYLNMIYLPLILRNHAP